MGGKKTQRTKNNVKPSSSSRSAELLGSAVPSFVGFSAHSELGLVAFVPGFVNTEQLPDSYDINISPQFQLILRKMSKKDRMTKQKALLELIELINTSELDAVKSFLPIWPKYYQNLATDTEHNVRELAQTVLQLLVGKCKRAVAPTLKLIVPIWLVSHFDAYAPAASIARASFRETFAGNADRTCEVCLHCQSEIMEYAGRNLTFHTPATLSTGKSLAPEEAEQKYQRMVIGSLKALSFFLEHTAAATDLSQAQSQIRGLLGIQKFWSFAKHKVQLIKAAWFELLSHILQSSSLGECRAQMKLQITTICFQNLHDSDPIVAPQVWGCILQVQAIYPDWYRLIPLNESVLPKLSSLLRNGFNQNAVAISPHLLPFFSKFADGSLPELDRSTFCKKFFDDIKMSIMTLPSSCKSDLSAIIKAYFECLRYQFQITNNAVELRPEYEALAIHLLNDNILEPIEAFLASDNVAAKPFFLHSSALVAFWADRQRGEASFYSHLLDTFWICVFRLITEGIGNEAVHDSFLEHVLELIHDLQVANPSLEVASVKFADVSIADHQSPMDPKPQASTSSAVLQSSASFIQEKLRQLLVQLVRLCLDNVRSERGPQYIGHVRRHMQMFADAEFYASLTEERTVHAALDLFVQLLCESDESTDIKNEELNDNDANASRRKTNEVVVEIIFEMLRSLSKSDQFAYIRRHLIKIQHNQIQTLVLEQLLSYPLCIEPEVRSLLAEPVVCGFIANLAAEIVAQHKKEELNLLHKCFFQTDDGEILIDATTVDIILETLSEPIVAPTGCSSDAELDDMVDACGSFIAQIMPVVCSNENASKEARCDIFLKLFRFTMERAPNDYISEDTFWEITTSWQDALSSDDIVVDYALLDECAAGVEHGSLKDTLTPARIDIIAEAVAKFIVCATENVDDAAERLQRIEETMAALLRTSRGDNEAEQRAECHLEDYCAFHETLKGAVTSSVELKNSTAQHLQLHPIFSRTLINLSTILKLVCRTSSKEQRRDSVDDAVVAASEAPEEDEVTADYCDPNEFLLEDYSELLFAELLKCIRIAAIGDSLITNGIQVETAIEALMLQVSECVRTLMREGGSLAVQVSERMLQQACDQAAPTACRPLLYLAFSEQYAQFEENAPILLAEAFSDYFVPRNALRAYVNSLQYLMPQLLPRSITTQCAIMATEPEELWLRAAMFRCLVKNNFDAALNHKDDKAIIVATLQFVMLVAERQHAQRDLLLYNVDLRYVAYARIVDTTEYINLLAEVVARFPHELNIKHWDTIRIGLSSWMLTASQSIFGYEEPKIAAFVGGVARLFVAMSRFVTDEKTRSSTELIASVVDEWQSLFAREVNLVLFKAFFKLARLQDEAGDYIDCYVAVFDEIISAVELIHYGVVYAFCLHSEKISLDTLCNFLLKNLSNPVHSIRICCVYIMQQLTHNFIATDLATFEKSNDTLPFQQQEATKWHFLNRFEDYIGRYSLPIQNHLIEFSFKLSEIPEMTPINRHEGMTFLLLWDCIVYACANAPVSLRSLYTNWLHEYKYDENLLLFLFRAMPAEVLRNHDSKLVNHSDLFRTLSLAQIKDRNISLERYACHMYVEVLLKLPAVVRRWWNASASRQKTFVDKLTTQFVSTLICNEELRSIANYKDKLENMQVTVHTSTREVLAVYTIDEVRMELVITLAPNYPLGAVKVECGRQIGNKTASRNFSMQLTIFLTHQNGTIYDGLTMWKNNLDKKFEGVEECYVCYTVIHQDTCQLPKLTCKTCKKKFHGTCLFKWFTTSSKSTCPICRNVF